MRAILSAITLFSVSLFVVLSIILSIIVGAVPQAAAQSAADTYPYCALDASSGATSCYYSSRAQCGARCIDNPGYVGPRGVTARTPGRNRLPRR